MKFIQKGLRLFVVVVAFVFVVAQFKRPEKVNLAFDEARAIETRVGMTPEVEAILARSCNDCHSQKTDWPWYSNIAPVSWFVVEHVNHGRTHLDFSDWSAYESDEADHLLRNICRLSRQRSMPMSSYTLMHRDAKLSARDVETLCDWTETARLRLILPHTD